MRNPRAILITGASGAIGGALAESYSAPGIHLFLHGRNRLKLAELASQCEARGANVSVEVFDVTDLQGSMAWLEELNARQPLDLVVINAGMNINIGPTGQGEAWEKVDELLTVNLRSGMAMVHAVLPGMRQRGRGQIALISSLAAYYGLPLTPSYSASKAAVKAYGEGLRGWLAPEGIEVNVVMPGYVASKMCHEMPGPKPFLLTPEQAAHRIRKGLERNQARISFPFPLNFGTWWLAVLPSAVSQRILSWLGYGH